MRRPTQLLLVLSLFWLPQTSRSAITLSDWTITADSISFQLSGTFTAGTAPSANLGLLWLAAPGSGSWINNDTNPDFTISGTIDGYDTTSSVPALCSFTGNGTTNVGAYIDYGGELPPPSGTTFNFTDGSGNEVNIQVAISSAGKYNPSQINPQDLQLYWGGDAFSADTASAVSLNLAVVPEPATYAIFASLGALALAVWRRRRAA